MILTNKCREDFNKWMNEKLEEGSIDRIISDEFEPKKEYESHFVNSLCNPMFLDFFDEKGYVIECTLNNIYVPTYNVEIIFKELDRQTIKYGTSKGRQQSIQYGILKANDLYNIDFG